MSVATRARLARFGQGDTVTPNRVPTEFGGEEGGVFQAGRIAGNITEPGLMREPDLRERLAKGGDAERAVTTAGAGIVKVSGLL